MAISAMILDPQNDFEKHIFFPVATESFFKEFSIPAIQSLGLQWVDLLSTGVDVEEEGLPSILAELDKLKEWVHLNLEEEQKTKLFERVEGLKEKHPMHFNVKT
ncbi:hypothetical protein [Peribacillus sp. NPDC096540]|uniref:hypothetical protein n=1 Tax=Peribacillus sp. NPDC096540 TaxID=3390612 RepID=UPI003CFEA85B